MDLASKTTYVPGLRVFFFHPEDAWIVGEISAVGTNPSETTLISIGSKNFMVLDPRSGDELSVKESQLHPVVSEEVLETTDDLLKLNELHESTLLHNIRQRYFQNKICTVALDRTDNHRHLCWANCDSWRGHLQAELTRYS